MGGPGLRFTLEAAFLIVLAVAAGLAELSPTTIVLVMGGAWLLVAAIEWLAWRESPRVSVRAREEPAPVAEAESGTAVPRRGRRFWRRRSEAEPVEPVAVPPPQAAPPGEDTEDLDPPAEQPAQVPAEKGTGT
jgi:hypothetical protein